MNCFRDLAIDMQDEVDNVDKDKEKLQACNFSFGVPWLYHGARRNTFGTGEIMGVQGKDAEIKGYILLINGAPGRIRTCDLRIRSPLLYPAELQALFCL